MVWGIFKPVFKCDHLLMMLLGYQVCSGLIHKLYPFFSHYSYHSGNQSADILKAAGRQGSCFNYEK